MVRDEIYRDIVSSQPRNPLSKVFALPLSMLSIPYGAVMRARNALYDRGVLKAHGAGVPVISVGNLTAGGTGKTPLVAYLAEEASRRGLRPAVVARGYKGELREGEWINDEGLLLRERIPGLIVVQDPDRVAAAARAVQERGAGFIILDDAFQHRRIRRDRDIVTLDAREPFGNGRLLPAGLLREPAGGLRRANAIVLTRCDGTDRAALSVLEARLRELSGGAEVFRTTHAPVRIRVAAREEDLPLEWIDGKRVLVFSGIAVPGSFERTVASLGGRIVETRSFPDHHHYSAEDVLGLARAAGRAGADIVATTAKDAVKLSAFEEAGEFAVVDVTVKFLAGEEEFRRLAFDGLA
jgi:tetraacyldisaccharide 4'-kinase